VGVKMYVTNVLLEGTIVYQKDFVLTDMGMSPHLFYVISVLVSWLSICILIFWREVEM